MRSLQTFGFEKFCLADKKWTTEEIFEKVKIVIDKLIKIKEN